MKLFRAENCRDLVFIGTLVRPALSEIRLDWGTLRVLGRVWAAFRGGDDHLLSGIGGILDLLDSLLFNAPIMYLYLRHILT